MLCCLKKKIYEVKKWKWKWKW